MILLENKIAIFNKIVFLKQKEECEKRIKEEKEKAAKILEDKIKSLEEDEKAYVDRRVNLAKRRGYELIASVEEQKRVLFLEEDEKLLNELLETLSERLLEFTKTDEYVEKEAECFRNILDEIDEKAIYLYAVSYTHLTLPTNREV